VLRPFTYHKPQTIEEVTALVVEHGERAKILAGGTDLFVGMRGGEFDPEVVIDIKGIPALHRMHLENGSLSIGAAITINEILESPKIPKDFPVLKEAGSRMASYQIRNRATVVGNLCTASPAADMATPLMVLGARARVLGSGGERWLPMSEFFVGCKECASGPEEWVVAVEIKKPAPGARMGFLKHGRVRGPDLSLVNCAAVLNEDGALQLALGAVAETPVLIPDLGHLVEAGGSVTEKIDTIVERVRETIKPIDDVRSSAEYRMDLATIMVRRLLGRLVGGC
jgi:carbon-monoxide dehydrogenase medium subunit